MVAVAAASGMVRLNDTVPSSESGKLFTSFIITSPSMNGDRTSYSRNLTVSGSCSLIGLSVKKVVVIFIGSLTPTGGLLS